MVVALYMFLWYSAYEYIYIYIYIELKMMNLVCFFVI